MSKPFVLGLFALSACANAATPEPGAQGEPGVPGALGEMGTMGTPGTQGAAGQACWDLDNNGTCDLGNEDTNSDGTCDVGDCIGPQGAAGTPGTAGTTGQLGNGVFGTATLTVTPTTVATLIPGLTTTVDVPANSVVMISTDGGVATTSTAATGFSTVDVVIAVDGALLANGGYKRIIAANTTGITGVFAPWSMSAVVTLAPGLHTIQVQAAGTGGASANATLSGDATNVNQGSLSVLVLKK
jgi:hypothetical protein